MLLKTYFNGSCAVSSIEKLGSHSGPVDAMRYFCNNELGKLNDFCKKYGTLAAFYTFVAGPEVPFGEPGGSHHSSATWVKYGTEFAQFIRENKLGEVATVGPKINFKHHKTTTAQVWLWNPDQAALEAWWTAQCKTSDNS